MNTGTHDPTQREGWALILGVTLVYGSIFITLLLLTGAAMARWGD